MSHGRLLLLFPGSPTLDAIPMRFPCAGRLLQRPIPGSSWEATWSSCRFEGQNAVAEQRFQVQDLP